MPDLAARTTTGTDRPGANVAPHSQSAVKQSPRSPRRSAIPVLKLGLQARFLLIVVLGAAVFALLAGAMAYSLGHRRVMTESRATLEALVTAVEKSAAIGTYAQDKVLLDELIHGLARNPLVATAFITDPGNKVLVQHSRNAKHDVSDGLTVERRLASPFDTHETVGTLCIRADAAQLEQNARAEAKLFAQMMVLHTALLALLLYAVAALLVSRPIVELAGALRTMQPGTDRRLSTAALHQHDEIGTLIAGANDLLQANETALRRERDLRAEIEKMEAQYRKIFDSSSAGIFVLDNEGRLINTNPTALRVIGQSLESMQQLRGEDFVRQVFTRPERVLSMMSEAATRGETVSADLELRCNVGDGESTWVHCLISVQGLAAPGDERSQFIEGVMYDITERKRRERAVLHQAEHDALTGLRNRMSTEAALDSFVAEAAAGTHALAVIYADLDGFKQINDSLGHKAGDQVLQRVAERMQAVLRRSSDVVGRMGGDEFVLLLNRLGSDDLVLAQIAAQLLDRLQEHITLEDGTVVSIGVSLGIACYPRHGDNRKQLMHAADEAMYEVKRHGKNAYAMAIEAPVMS